MNKNELEKNNQKENNRVRITSPNIDIHGDI